MRVFIVSFLLSLVFFLLPSTVRAQGLVSSLDSYCKDSSGTALGYYVADQGKSCGRAPFCAGKSLQDAAAVDWTSVKQCWDHRCDYGMCQGQVPLCCYEIERTGDPNYCTWPEREYCHPSQCDKISADKLHACIGSDFVTPVDCHCGIGVKHWCNAECGKQADGSDIPYVPLAQRVGSGIIPSNTPTVTPSTDQCLSQKRIGDYDCSGVVNAADFDAWKTDFLASRSTLSFFEYWRRVAMGL